jgi:hypothetical protein
MVKNWPDNFEQLVACSVFSRKNSQKKVIFLNWSPGAPAGLGGDREKTNIKKAKTQIYICIEKFQTYQTKYMSEDVYPSNL